MIGKSKQVMLLWLEGFVEACSLHRVVILCHRSRKLLLRTGQCFLLNGLIFLGSLGVFRWFVNPALQWILPDPCAHGSYAFLRGCLLQLFYVFWFYPLYMLSFILSNIWYNDVAKYGFEAIENSETFRQREVPASVMMTNAERPAGLGGYKWNFLEIPLEKRLDFFESNWAFFAGFGSPCVLPIFFLSPLVSGALMAILFPLFVLTATGSAPEKYIAAPSLLRLPIFYAADRLSMLALSIFRLESLQHEKTG